MAIVLFPSLPFDLHAEDPSWAAERAASRAAGLGTALVDHTRVLAGESPAAVARVERGAGTAVWRGWMMPPARYAELFEALDARGVHLINDPAAYRRCHYLPEVLPFLGEDTPGSVWLPVTGDVRFEDVHERLRVFGSAPLVLKDFVKSQKHHWDAACFIPAADDRARVEAVTRRFLELQGEDLAEGLVYRAYVPLARVGVHPKSGTPLAAEWRTFWLDGERALAHPYWADLPVELPPEPPASWVEAVARRIPSRFFTLDVALREDGGWLVVEAGDGQVSGLPTDALCPPLHAALAARLGVA